ncbi:hypothetical protein EV182_004856, partial [Spiromyces aspiralis]
MSRYLEIGILVLSSVVSAFVYDTNADIYEDELRNLKQEPQRYIKLKFTPALVGAYWI